GKRTKQRQRKPSHVSIRTGQVEFVKVGTDAWRWRDVYRWLLGLRWPQFAAFVASLYVGLNLFFAALYSLQQDSIAGSTGGHRFFDFFFFSVQTLATVGYGHMYPQTLYGHIISTIEIMNGIFLLAAMTGLIFVRFSRPIARVVFSNSLVGIDPVLAASVQTQKDYTWRDIQFGHRFVEIYTEHGGGRLTVDYGRLHDIEPA